MNRKLSTLDEQYRERSAAILAELLKHDAVMSERLRKAGWVQSPPRIPSIREMAGPAPIITDDDGDYD